MKSNLLCATCLVHFVPEGSGCIRNKQSQGSEAAYFVICMIAATAR